MNTRREMIQLAAERAKSDPRINMRGLALTVGWKHSMIAKFIKTGIGSDEKVAELERQLRSLGIIRQPAWDVADDLRGLAAFLESGETKDIKAAKFRQWVETAHKSLTRIVNRIEEGIED